MKTFLSVEAGGLRRMRPSYFLFKNKDNQAFFYMYWPQRHAWGCIEGTFNCACLVLRRGNGDNHRNKKKYLESTSFYVTENKFSFTCDSLLFWHYFGKARVNLTKNKLLLWNFQLNYQEPKLSWHDLVTKTVGKTLKCFYFYYFDTISGKRNSLLKNKITVYVRFLKKTCQNHH